MISGKLQRGALCFRFDVEPYNHVITTVHSVFNPTLRTMAIFPLLALIYPGFSLAFRSTGCSGSAGGHAHLVPLGTV